MFEWGPPKSVGTLVVLHDIDYLKGVEHRFLQEFARRWRVLMPSHPGFGNSSLPPHFDAVDDLAYVYLDLLRQTGPVHLLGFGFGGWVAAEVAIRCSHNLRSLVLVDALGIKVGDRTTADIADMFVVSPSELVRLSWHDPELGIQLMPLPIASAGFDAVDLTLLLSNRRTAALVGWRPFMHEPKLRGRLGRVDCPTLVIWGASDGIVSPAYGQAYAAAIPGAKFATIPLAGHYPYLEQPRQFVQRVEEFLIAAAERA